MVVARREGGIQERRVWVCEGRRWSCGREKEGVGGVRGIDEDCRVCESGGDE